MKLQLLWGVLILLFCLGPGLEAAEIYQWIDKDGVQHFTNEEPPPGAQIVEGLSEAPADTPPAKAGPPDLEDSGAVKGRGNQPADRGDAGAVEGGENEPADNGDPGAVEGGENGRTGREEYWRRRGWGNDANGGGNAGAVEGNENRPSAPDDSAPAEGGENEPANRSTD